jgi:hypothetical protein
MTLCRHCKRHSVNRPRGLCWTCYYTPGVRDSYPSTSKYAAKYTEPTGMYRLPDTSTEAVPGTPDKEAVLTERATAGVNLFHPLDRQLSS